jgi:hypothetical protein
VINPNHPALERRTGDHAMTSVTTKLETTPPPTGTGCHLFDFEAGIRDHVRDVHRGDDSR